MGKEVPMPWRETCAMDERMKLMLELEAGEESVSELCRYYGVSRKTAYKWRSRYRLEGCMGLSDRSRAPLYHPQAMSKRVVAAVLDIRHRHTSWGGKKIRAYLKRHHPEVSWPAVSSIGDLLRRQTLSPQRFPQPSLLPRRGGAPQLFGLRPSLEKSLQISL